MKKAAIAVVAGLVLLAGAHPAAAQTGGMTVTGKVGWGVDWVLDTSNPYYVHYVEIPGPALAGATVVLLAGPRETDTELARATTDARGGYTLTLPAGQTAWVHVRTGSTWWGYTSTDVTARAGVTREVNFGVATR